MWPFTCYSPRNRNCLPCFRDISPEELRWNMIEAEQTGTLQSYFQNVNETLSQINLRREELKHPTSQYINSLNKYETNNSPVSFQNMQKALHQTSFKLPENENKAGSFQTFSSSSFNEPRNSFNFSNMPQQSFPQQFISEKISQNNAFGNVNNNAKSFSFTQALKKEMSTFPTTVSLSSSSPSSNNTETLINNFDIDPQQSFGKKLSKNINYTELTALSKLEKEQFMASAFTLGRIPTKPPPIELCF